MTDNPAFDFFVHKEAPTWRLVLASNCTFPTEAQKDHWRLTRTRSAKDTNEDVRKIIKEKGFCLFKLGGEFAEVESDRQKNP